MTTFEAVQKAELILRLADITLPKTRTFLEYSKLVAEVAKGLPASSRALLGFDFKDWAYAWRRLHDEFDKIVTADPMIAYQPAHQVALEFHSSLAYVRYYMAGNRTSKTQSGYAEHYFVTTGQHKWRPFIRPPIATFIIGVDYAHYAQKVFGAKLLEGETDNPLSPMFPPGGKWFYHYDERKHLLKIACPECAEKGKAGSCPHPKSSIQLFSDEGTYKVLMGAQYALGHFDEHVDESFYNEARMRTKTVRGGCLIVTGTPLNGDEAWEVRKLYQRFLNGAPDNLFDPDSKDSPLYCSVHQIDQFKAGLSDPIQLRADMKDMDEFEIEARVYGKPAPFTDTPVFNRRKLANMRSYVRKPWRGELLYLVDGQPGDLRRVPFNAKIERTPIESGNLRIWKDPEPNAVYICAVDTAAGLRDRDASCASIVKCHIEGPKVCLELVAQWHGWMTPLQYADEVLKLCILYNSALCVVELTGGLGRAVVLKMKDEYTYWNMYRERVDFTQIEATMDPRIGIETNQQTKPFMVSALQMLIQEGRIAIPCEATLQELQAYEQVAVGSGGNRLLSPKFQGAKGSADDRTMSLVIAASIAISYTQLLYQVEYQKEQSAPNIKDAPEFWQSLYRETKEKTVE